MKTVEIDPSAQSRRETYKLTIASVIPRPIAWTSTVSAEGIPNLAPFSFFNVVTSDPPTVMISVGRRRGVQKDTAVNLLATGEAVIHIPTLELAEKMVLTSKEADPEVDEFGLAELERVPASVVRPFRLKDAHLAMEAKVVRHIEIGRSRNDLFLLEVVRFHVDTSLLRADGTLDPSKLDAVGRLGGQMYAETRARFELARPV